MTDQIQEYGMLKIRKEHERVLSMLTSEGVAMGLSPEQIGGLFELAGDHFMERMLKLFILSSRLHFDNTLKLMANERN